MNSFALEPAAAPQAQGPRKSSDREGSAVGEIVVDVQGVGKCYRMYKRPQDRLKQSLCLGRRRYFDEFWALREVTFQLRRGETIGIIGRNGSGKSTLLQTICGTLQPTLGTVTRHGRVAALLELGAGFNPEFTGRENVFLNAAIMGLPQEEVARRLGDILAFADIGEHVDQPVKTYSSGMFMRLAFSVVAHVDADVLIIDEALSVGDALFNQKCMRFLRRFREHGSLLFVSHDTSAVTSLCHRVIWLERGAVRQTGAAKEVCQSYLASYFESQQGPHAVRHSASIDRMRRRTDLVDQRQQYVNQPPSRDDLLVFPLDESGASSGGERGCITSARLLNEQGTSLNWVEGRETVTLRVEAQAAERISQPVIGFLVKDRLGQVLFSDNTCVSQASSPVPLEPGETLEAEFTFEMPILRVGDYSISVCLAEATHEGHRQHHWLHDSILFKSITSRVCRGLVGVPILGITMQKTDSEV